MTYLTIDDWPTTTHDMRAEVERHRETLRAVGFRPAYFDYATGTLYPSRHADGSPAELHVPDGLPDEVVAVRACDQVIAVRTTLLTGFERGGYFFTKSAALRAARDWGFRA